MVIVDVCRHDVWRSRGCWHLLLQHIMWLGMLHGCYGTYGKASIVQAVKALLYCYMYMTRML